MICAAEKPAFFRSLSSRLIKNVPSLRTLYYSKNLILLAACRVDVVTVIPGGPRSTQFLSIVQYRYSVVQDPEVG